MTKLDPFLKTAFHVVLVLIFCALVTKWIFPLIKLSPVECLLENHSHRTISKINFYYVTDATVNEVNIPPQSDAIVEVPRSRGEGRFVYPGSPYAQYNIYIEFSDGFNRRWDSKNLRHCGKIIIYEQNDTIQADFQNGGVYGLVDSIVTVLKNFLKSIVMYFINSN